MIAFEDSDKFSGLPAKGPKGPHMPVFLRYPISWVSQFYSWVEGGAHFSVDRGDFLAQPAEILSVCKSNRLHVDILRFSSIKLEYIP